MRGFRISGAPVISDLASRIDRLERLALALAVRYGNVGSLANSILKEIEADHGSLADRDWRRNYHDDPDRSSG